MKNNYLALSALSSNKAAIITDLANLAQKSGCSVANSHINQMGNEYAIMMLIGGNWSTIAKFEAGLVKLEKKYAIKFASKRTETPKEKEDTLPYSVQVIAKDAQGIVYEVCKFFTDQQITIVDMYCNTYPASRGDCEMFSINLALNVPADMQISELREQFIVFCDELNWDAILEPERN